MVLGIGEATHYKLALLDATKRVVEVGGDLTIDYDKTRRRLAYPWHTSWRSTRRTWWLLSAMPEKEDIQAIMLDRPMAIGRTTVVAFETHRGGKILLTLGEAFSIRNHSEEFKGDRGSHDGFLLQLKKKVIWL
uniref:Uncharacterized protein n=1 Tax=Oryza nivara TaxID=4536 RepID=A0A0E0IQE9_ORYNI